MEGEKFLTVQQVAEAAQVSEETVRRWLRSGRLKGNLIGGTRSGYRVRESDLRRFLSGSVNGQTDGGNA